MREENANLGKITEPFAEFMTAFFEINNKRKSEVKIMGTVTNITVEMGEECKVDVNILHKTLEKLPADMYLDLFHKMQMKIYGYPPFPNFGINGCCGTVEDNPK